MRILHVAAEAAPWAKTGGLGDVVSALPPALARLDDTEVATVIPRYNTVSAALYKHGRELYDTGVETAVWFGDERVVGRFYGLVDSESPVFFLQCHRFFERGGIYGDGSGSFGDNCERFIFLSRAALQAGAALMGGPPHVVHAHDWHTGLIPALMATTERYRYPGAASVFTIHNLAYQGICSADLLYASGLDTSAFHPEGAEYHGLLNLLKAGAAFADVVTTVSPGYAREVRTPAFGYQLDGLLRRRGVHGILNGVDLGVWNPRVDPHLPATYGPETLDDKRQSRDALLSHARLEADPETLVLGVVSRLVGQKGIQLIAGLVPFLHNLGAKLVLLGTGSKDLEAELRYLSGLYGDSFTAIIDFDEPLAHLVMAGCDAYLMPSLFEPCGLNQMYALAYGTVPIVHAVGGLADTVHDTGNAALARGEGTGFRFDHPTLAGLHWAVGRAAGLFRADPDGWRRLQQSGMARDHAWANAASEYRALYARVAR